MSTLTQTSVRKSHRSLAADSLILNAEPNGSTAADSSEPFPTGYRHKPSLAIIAWLMISLPLVIWDTGYVQLRPYSMPGGSLHSPIWSPYSIYSRVDLVYGFPAWDGHNGFTGAQSAMNIPETLFSAWYLYIVASQIMHRRGQDSVFNVGIKGSNHVNFAVLLCFASAVMTLSKTVLYCRFFLSFLYSRQMIWVTNETLLFLGLSEAYSGFEGIGHNSMSELFWVWIVPNGAWLVMPTYLIYVFGKEILGAMRMGDDERKEK